MNCVDSLIYGTLIGFLFVEALRRGRERRRQRLLVEGLLVARALRQPGNCPFCRSASSVICFSADQRWYIACTNPRCNAQGPLHHSEDSAFRLWNELAVLLREVRS